MRGAASSGTAPIAAHCPLLLKFGCNSSSALGCGFCLIRAAELRKRCRQQEMGNTEAGFAANRRAHSRCRLLVAAAHEVPEANTMVGRCDPWIERTEADAALAPFDGALRIGAPSEDQRSPEVGRSGRWRKCQRRLKRFQRQGPIVFDKANRDAAQRQCRGVIRTESDRSMAMANAGETIFFFCRPANTEPLDSMRFAHAPARNSDRSRVRAPAAASPATRRPAFLYSRTASRAAPDRRRRDFPGACAWRARFRLDAGSAQSRRPTLGDLVLQGENVVRSLGRNARPRRARRSSASISWPVMRTRPAALRTLPSST